MLRTFTVGLVAACLLAGTSLIEVSCSGAPSYDKNLFDGLLKQTFDFCSNRSDEACAKRWINKFGKAADYFYNINARFSYAYSNQMDKELAEQMLQLSNRVQVWGLRHLRIARRFLWHGFRDAALRRRFKLLTMDATLENEADRLELSQLQQSLTNSYSSIAACAKQSNGTELCLPVGEQAVSDVIADESATYDFKLSLWRSWHDLAARAMAANFTAYVRLANKAARQIGFNDSGEADWMLDFESASFNVDVLTWQRQLSDLYTQLHAFVRHRLLRLYPGRFEPDGCLPAHILGHDQWAQQWRLEPDDFPHPPGADHVAIDYSELLVRKFGNFTGLVRAAEEFYKSIGMPGMTQEFWQRSDFFQPTNASVVKDCHASAWEFASPNDFRIKMCGRIGREDFYVIHHEMGHVEYFMAYSRLPREFRNSANSGFHEAVGDTMALSVNTNAHFATLGILPTGHKETPEEELNSLFSMALDKVAFLPFALTAGQDKRNYSHSLVVGVDRYPRTITKGMGKRRAAKKTKLKPFIKIMNHNHVLPTRYVVDVTFDSKVVNKDAFKDAAAKRKAMALVKSLEEKYKSGKNKWFFTKLRF